MIDDIGNVGMESRVASITVDRPQDGETLTVAVTPGLRVVLEFNPAAAKFAVEGDDFVLTLEDGAQVVFAGLVSAAQGGDVPTLHFASIDVDADVLMEQILALAGADGAEPIETAAGEDGEGEEGEAADGGGSHYDDFFGDLIAGLIKQGIIGETDLGFGLFGNGGMEFLVEAAFLSEGYLLSGGGFGPLGAGVPSGPVSLAGTGLPSSGVGSLGPLPDVAPLSDGGELDTSYTFAVNGMNFITNEASGILEIPDELVLYLATADHGAGLNVTGPSNGGGNNASIWDFGDPVPVGSNTWANHNIDHVKLNIGGSNPTYDSSFTYQVADGLGGTGTGAIGVQNAATGMVGGYRTLNGTGADEVLLGLDGRNNIDGGAGDDIIHGGHDASGDILIGGDGNDVIFGGTGNDDLQGGAGDDTFIMRAGFGRDDIDGGAGTDIIAFDSVLTQAEMDDPGSWLTLGAGTIVHVSGSNTVTFSGGTASGTIDLGGGNEITFVDVEQIDYAIPG